MYYRKGVTALIVAAGKSERAGEDKLSLMLGSESVLERTLCAFLGHPKVDGIVLVGREVPEAYLNAGKPIVTVRGGSTRADSVKNGLKAVETDIVLIHDGARPFTEAGLISEVIEGVLSFRSAIPVVPVADSVRIINKEGELVEFPKRDTLSAAQTPQGFYTADITEAYRRFEGTPTDESEVYGRAFGKAHAVKGRVENRKITTKEDVLGIKAVVGSGWDLHRLGDVKPLKICGVAVAPAGGSFSWSDGDAAYHAVTDAILSALGEKDIGQRFPDKDPKFKNADSGLFLKDVAELAFGRGKTFLSLSVAIELDSPKLAPHISGMRRNLSEILNISESRIGITAKTSEGTSPSVIRCWAVVTLV